MDSNGKNDCIIFRYVWTTRVSLRQLGSSEAVILQVSPKFATVTEHIAFQWSLKMFGTTYLHSEDEDFDDGGETLQKCSNFVAISLYFNDGPVSPVSLRAVIGIIGDKTDNDQHPQKLFENEIPTNLYRGREWELTCADRIYISDYIKDNIGLVVRLFLLIELPSELFDPSTYINAHSPTPIASFLTANYRARASSKIWKRKSRRSKNSLEANCQGKDKAQDQNVNYEEIFNRVMDQEREKFTISEEQKLKRSEDSDRRPSACSLNFTKYEDEVLEPKDHLFKKLLIACCETCERRASLSQEEKDDDDDSSDGESSDENTFECNNVNKEGVHDLLANMYFDKVVLPGMDYVEDFADFLIDAELNDLPVLKRACERYLCGELISKKDLLTSVLLDLLFLSIVFNLPVMKSITLSELSNRPEDLEDPEILLTKAEYKSLDRRMRKMSERNLVELIEDIQRFREQRLRVQIVKA